MTNQEKYKTTEERETAFRQFCKTHGCEKCPLLDISETSYGCLLNWLEMKAKEELLPCPFCGGEAEVFSSPIYNPKRFAVRCKNNRCDIRPCTEYRKDINIAIDAWNRRTK